MSKEQLKNQKKAEKSTAQGVDVKPMVSLPFVGDIVSIKQRTYPNYNPKFWEGIGVVVHLTRSRDCIDDEPNMAQVIWVNNNGLTLHWHRENLIVIRKREGWPEDRPQYTDPNIL